MNAIRKAFIMAFLVNHGTIHRKDIVYACGISKPQATIDLRDFQNECGKLFYDHGTRSYTMPTGYTTTIDRTFVQPVISEIVSAFGMKHKQLSNDQRASLRELKKYGVPVNEIAAIFGVNASTVWRVCKEV